MELDRLKGIGGKRREALNKLGIFSVEDLIAFLPARYRDLTVISKLNAVPVDTPALFKVRLAEKPRIRYPRKNFSISTCGIEDISGPAEAVWFNQPYIAKQVEPGQDVYLYGSIVLKQGRRRLMNPSVEQADGLNITPVYRISTSAGISQKVMRDIMKQAIEILLDSETEVFDDAMRIKHSLCSRAYAVKNIHFPESETALLAAKRRLSFEELIRIRIFIKLHRDNNIKEAGKIFDITVPQADDFIKSLPYALTNAQSRCLEEIKKDVSSGRAMNRLVQGDVGCGKTVVAIAAMVLAAANNTQAALMAPTDILARQHYETLKSYFGEENTVFLSGGLTQKERKDALDKIRTGEAKYIVGTNALVQKGVEYNDLALVICDEQHRFGVAQRARFQAKGNSPHMLVMSATPIPRTLSLIVFGDLDISIIDELPAGRQKVFTSIIPRRRENDMLNYIKNELLAGKQAYFVCPLIEEDEENPLESAEGLFERLKKDVFKDIPIELMHGRMTAEEKKDVMERFAKNEIRALVSTTVIEVGINVKNASVMVIYGSDRFGLAQLHQLRGRVGRGNQKAYCFMLTDSQNPETLERLKIMTKTNNGFEIAQYDYELRGPGDYIGKRQSGIPEARFSYALSNTALLKETETVTEKEILPDPERFRALTDAVNRDMLKEAEDIAYN